MQQRKPEDQEGRELGEPEEQDLKGRWSDATEDRVRGGRVCSAEPKPDLGYMSPWSTRGRSTPSPAPRAGDYNSQQRLNN